MVSYVPTSVQELAIKQMTIHYKRFARHQYTIWAHTHDAYVQKVNNIRWKRADNQLTWDAAADTALPWIQYGKYDVD